MTNELMNGLTLTTALTSPRVIDAPAQQLEYTLAQAMAKAYADMGINATDRHDEITYLVQTMPAQVTQTLPCLKLNEIPVAINNGIMRQYGDFYGLNVATFMHFLLQHYKSTQRAEAVKATLNAAKPEPVTPTPAELKQMRLQRITTAFAHYKAHGFYNDYGSLVFDAINGMGKIPFGEAKEAAILQQAHKNLMARYSKISVYPDERQKLRANLELLRQGNGNSLILTEAKHLALTELFDCLITKGLSIAEFLRER